MLGLFGTLSLAARSLQTQMTGVEVSGQNLANVNTTGYSRQTVDIETSPEITTAIGPEGTGANVVAIQQAINTILNSQIQTQQSANGYWNSQQSALQDLQNSLDEFLNGTNNTTSTTNGNSTSDTGLAGQLTTFFNAAQQLATSPTSIPARQNFVTQAQNLATMFNQIVSQTNSTRSTLDTSLSNDVDSANKLLTDIASLNKQIGIAQTTGGTPNTLLDQREQDLENLAQLTNIQTSNGANNAIDVSIGGQTLVSGSQLLDTLQTYDVGGGQLLVQTATGGTPLTLTGGSIQGTIDARDGELATLQGNIYNLASNLMTQVNSIYSTGYNLNGGSGASLFFGTNASDITVNPSLAIDPTLVQASSSPTAPGDNTVALQIANLASTTLSGLNNQTFGSSYDQTVAGLGGALQNANTQVSNQASVTNMLQTQRSSVSGVNIDEEMTNLMGFQRAYEASAQLVTTVNQMMETVIQMKS